MGQKVHPEVFKLSRTSGWESKYYEKKTTDFSSQTHKSIEIKRFVQQFFKQIGLNLHTCKLNCLNSKMNISASYIKSSGLVNGVSSYVQKKSCKRIQLAEKPLDLRKSLRSAKKAKAEFYRKKLLLRKLDKLFFLTCTKNPSCITTKPILNEFNSYSKKYLPVKYTLKQNFYSKILKVPLKKSLGCVSKVFTLSTLKNKQKLCGYRFLSLFFKIFAFCYQKNLKISLVFKILNKNLKKAKPVTLKKVLRKKVMNSLRRYNRNKFFKKAINLIFLMASQKESAKILSSFISNSIRNFKRHKWFLKFIKKSLYALVRRKKTVLKALTIQLKGRINGRDRARSYLIKVGKRASLIKIGARINYAETTAFTPDGTLSVKVWLEYQKLSYAKCTTENKVQKNKKR
jgi:hypothetical protein